MDQYHKLVTSIIIKFSKFISSIIICLGAGWIGSLFTTPKIASWYSTLEKPFFTPPNWLFGPVWTILYILMGISLYLVWNKKRRNNNRKLATIAFIIQLLLNVMWSLVFFALESPFLALLVIVLLWLAISITIYLFYAISRWSSYLLIPYLMWVSFAIILNISIVVLN